GTDLPVMVTASPIILKNNIIGAIASFRDMTKERQLDKARSEFISIASHQLRVPVQTLVTLIDQIRPYFTKASKQNQVRFGELSTSVGWLSKLVEDLLNVSQIESGSLKLSSSQINIPEFVEVFLRDMTTYATSKNHELIFKNSLSESVMVLTDHKLL